MAITLGLRLTTAGETEMVAAVVEHRPFDISHMVLGDANGAWYEVTGLEQTLLNECARIPLLSITPHPEHSNRIVCDAPIPLDVGGFTIREFGVVSPTGLLLAIGMHQEISLPDPGGPTIFDIIIRGMLDVLAIGVVNLVVDPFLVTATRGYVDAVVEAHSAPATVDAAGPVQLATVLETLAGLLDTKAVHPAALKAVLDAFRADLVGTAPELLNQLDEIAAALNNDPNLATTLITMMATHNTSPEAHADIRALVSTHNTATDAHADIRALMAKARAGRYFYSQM